MPCRCHLKDPPGSIDLLEEIRGRAALEVVCQQRPPSLRYEVGARRGVSCAIDGDPIERFLHRLPDGLQEQPFHSPAHLRHWYGGRDEVMRRQVREIENVQCEARACNGFETSVLFRSWSSLEVSSSEQISLCSVQKLETYRRNSSGIAVRIFALPVPSELANRSLAKLRLRDAYELLAFCMETEDGIFTDFSASTELVKGATLWVVFQSELSRDNIPALVRNFLGFEKQSLESRWLPLHSFNVKQIPKWINQTILTSKLRAEHGINVGGIYRHGEEKGKRFRNGLRLDNENECGVAFFPLPSQQLFAETVLLVLRSDVSKLNAIQLRNASTMEGHTSSDLLSSRIDERQGATENVGSPESRLPSSILPSRPARGVAVHILEVQMELQTEESDKSIRIVNTFIDQGSASPGSVKRERST